MKRGGIALFFLLFLLVILLPLTYAQQLKVTLEHPFLVNGEWIPAKQLQVGDILKTIDGKTARITEINDVVSAESFPVYNLEASQYSNFVLEDGVVAHNSNKPVACSVGCKNCWACGGPAPKSNPPRTVEAYNMLGCLKTEVVVTDLNSKANIDTVFKILLPDLEGFRYQPGAIGAKAIVDGRTGKIWFWKGDSGSREVHHIGMVAAASYEINPQYFEHPVMWNQVAHNYDRWSRFYGFQLQKFKNGCINAQRNSLVDWARFSSCEKYGYSVSQSEFDNAMKSMQDAVNNANRVLNPSSPCTGIVEESFDLFPITKWSE